MWKFEVVWDGGVLYFLSVDTKGNAKCEAVISKVNATKLTLMLSF